MVKDNIKIPTWKMHKKFQFISTLFKGFSLEKPRCGGEKLGHVK